MRRERKRGKNDGDEWERDSLVRSRRPRYWEERDEGEEEGGFGGLVNRGFGKTGGEGRGGRERKGPRNDEDGLGSWVRTFPNWYEWVLTEKRA